MKIGQILPAISLAIVLSGCSMHKKTYMSIDRVWYDKIYRPYIQTRTDIRYLAEPPCQDKWQSPYETGQLGKGDCEDFALYLQEKWRKEGIRSRVVIGKAVRDAEQFHVWNELDWGLKTWVVDASPSTGYFGLKEKVPDGRYIEKRNETADDKLRAYLEGRKYYAKMPNISLGR